MDRSKWIQSATRAELEQELLAQDRDEAELARYREAVLFVEWHASGEACPFCGAVKVTAQHAPDCIVCRARGVAK